MSNLTLIIGGTSSGKSPKVKELIKGDQCLVYDYQNEYGETNKYGEKNTDPLPVGIDMPRCRIFCSPDEFLEVIKRRKNTIIVWEEATGFFSGKIGQKLTQAVLSKAHTGNNFVFIFHAVQRVPKQIVEFTNNVILFKTGDQLEDIQKKIPKLLPHAIDLRRNSKQGKFHIIKLM